MRYERNLHNETFSDKYEEKICKDGKIFGLNNVK